MAAKAAGAFNYSVEGVDTKILPGRYGIVAQVNVNRKILRRKPDTILEIEQPVDPNKFNFNKIQSKEVLIELRFLVSKQEDGGIKKEEEKDKKPLKATVIINNAPICHTHSLLVPFLDECWPQVLNHQGLATAVHAILLSKSPDMRIAFNSLGGYASVNHLHFHLFYFPYTLYSETAECESLAGPCYVFKNHFAPGFVFQLENGDIDKLIKSVMILVNVFLKEKVAHNMFITRGAPVESVSSSEDTYSTVRVMLWARDFMAGAKDVDLLNTAACELAGHVPVYCPLVGPLPPGFLKILGEKFWRKRLVLGVRGTTDNAVSPMTFHTIVASISTVFLRKLTIDSAFLFDEDQVKEALQMADKAVSLSFQQAAAQVLLNPQSASESFHSKTVAVFSDNATDIIPGKGRWESLKNIQCKGTKDLPMDHTIQILTQFVKGSSNVQADCLS
ncbi:hypothetical protein O3P69_001743 [Scylla paramamosain]|uniref:GDPGP1-like N-terminal domain-containing protein n=1 Tax=Scylla paramamosain TaxID=85552 RepID=A0AAW0UZ67_SCYPA